MMTGNEMRRNRRELCIRYLKCPECGKINEIMGESGRKRKMGHIKTMVCFYCLKKADMEEVSEWQATV
jgi:hypothetical protein